MAAVKAKFDQSAKKPAPKKKSQKWVWWTGGIVVGFMLLLVMFYQPQATIHYGICKAYIELNDPYPTKIRYLGYVAQGYSTEIYYRSTDPFGVVSVNMMECYFEKNDDGTVGTKLEKVDLNRARRFSVEDAQKVKDFNVTIPSIIASRPNLSVPNFPLRDISKYREFHDDNM